MEKTRTACCALGQLNNVNNLTSIDEIEDKLIQLTKEMYANTEIGISTGNGQTAIFVIVSPGEQILTTNLVLLGFKPKHTFSRRIGYPEGNLKMYIKNLN
jgi:hypothetical protein